MIKYFDKISFKEIDKYINIFLEDGIVGFKQVNVSTEKQFKLISYFGDKLNWIPNSSSKDEEMYIENHTYTLSKPELSFMEKNIMLPWHLEGVENSNPPIASAWNMKKFTCDSSVGKTGFVDASKLFNDMPDDWKNFLINAEIQEKYPGDWNEKHIRNAAERHHITKEYVVRITATKQTDGCDTLQQLISVDKRPPSLNDVKKFTKIKEWIFKQVFYQDSRQLWWNWSQGDLLIPDLFKMHHAVTDGFSPEQREFVGFWCRKFPKSKAYIGDSKIYE